MKLRKTIFYFRMEKQCHLFYCIENSWRGPTDQIGMDRVDSSVFYCRYVGKPPPEFFHRGKFPVVSHRNKKITSGAPAVTDSAP